MIAPFRRSASLSGEQLATAVRGLAASIRSGTPPRLALETWPAAAPGDLAPALTCTARRLRLGGDVTVAVAGTDALGAAAGCLARCLELHARVGGSLPALLDSLADTLQRDAETGRRSRAATSGARLSGRLVAGLPLACLPLMPGARLLGSGLGGVLLLVAGLALAVTGLWWIGVLVPRPVEGDPAATFAEDLAVALRGGAALVPALDAIAACPPSGLEGVLGRARRKVALGRTWTAALEEEGGPPASVARVLQRSLACGVPAAGPLREWARTRRAEVAAEFDRALQRAPVLMVVPLTVCVLPSFALLAFGPFLLGALQGG